MEEFLRQIAEEKFKEALNLQDVQCTSDPENEPYKSKYKAREIFVELKEQLKKIQDEENDTPQLELSILTAVLDLKLGNNYIACEEPATGEEHLNKCIDVMLDHRLNPKCCALLLSGLNELGVLWAGRNENEKALGYLEKAEALYVDYKHEIDNAPYLSNEHFQVKNQDDDEGEIVQKRKNSFEDSYTHTMYYLAQVYGNLQQCQRSAEYCQETLKRQLDTGKYDANDWALNAATLSQFYITQKKFPQARHCLASAIHILQELGDPPENLTVTSTEDDSQEDMNKKEKIPKTWADIYRCWIKYGLMLLEYSQGKLYEKLEADFENYQYNPGEKREPEEIENKYEVNQFKLELTAIEGKITNKIVYEFSDAREVFLQTQRWIKSAKEFYALDGYCTDHVELIQDHSKLYKLLTGFESDLDRQCKMHKRRTDMLSEILNELSQQHYLMVCRQLMYELAETYSGMLDVKLANMETSETAPNQHAKAKINQLTTKSLEHFQTYMDTLKNTKKEMPSKFSDDDERPALVAIFCMGRLHSKYLESDPPIQIANIKKSLDRYQYITDYCKRNPESVNKIKSERDICEEMVVLLPTKMDRIRAQSGAVY